LHARYEWSLEPCGSIFFAYRACFIASVFATEFQAYEDGQ
jgi:hypothetical protein